MLDLTGTNPTRAGLAAHPVALLAALRDAEVAGIVGVAPYDPDPRGLVAAREAVAAYLAARVEGVAERESSGRMGGREAADPARIFLTASTSEAYAHLFRLLCEPGDEVLIPRPAYPLIEPIARVECVRAVPYRLAYHEGWRLDVDSLEASAGPRTRAVVLVQPNNPTGSCMNADEIERIEALCLARGIAIVADEVFGDFPWATEARSLPSVHGATRAATFTLGGVSKTCGLPQLKIAWIAASGPKEAVTPLLTGLEWILDLFLSVGDPAAAALPRLLEERGGFQAAMRARLKQNMRSLRDAADRSGGRFEVYRGDGGWSAIVRLEAGTGRDSSPVFGGDLAEWALAEHEVHLHPAHFYDLARDDLGVLSLVTDPAVLERALGRLLG